MPTTTYSTPGTYTFTAPDTADYTVRAWGGGEAGGDAFDIPPDHGSGQGGMGGWYAESVFPLTAGDKIDVQVGAGATGFGGGGYSGIAGLLAPGGYSFGGPSPIGDVTIAGGSGGGYYLDPGDPLAGGGGGGGGGTGGAGTDGDSGFAGGAGGAGGAGTIPGGAGGNGGTTGNGSAGSFPGGGGGGGAYSGGAFVGGPGADGMVIFEWSAPPPESYELTAGKASIVITGNDVGMEIGGTPMASSLIAEKNWIGIGIRS